MCRLLVVSSKNEIHIKDYLEEFAFISKTTLTPDGDQQKDGWGLLTYYQFYKSIKPIWEEKHLFSNFDQSQLLVAHARSASNGINNLNFNQPFFDNQLIFVFNGLLRGVKINIDGLIGSQKLFNLIKNLYKSDQNNFLNKFKEIIVNQTQLIVGMNIVIVDLSLKKINLISIFNQNEDYFTLHYYEDQEKIIICSNPLFNLNFLKIPSHTLKTIDLK
jgi:predicted glutamine amidotransferase